VRAVYGPSALLDISVDGVGKTRARPVLARGASESEGEAARQRVVRRADALGWFVSENGRRARFLVDTDDWRRVAPGVTTALVSSGLGLASESETPYEVRPLWPDPRRRNRWLPMELAAAWVFFALVAAARARIAPPEGSGARGIAPVLAVALAAAAPFALVPVWGIAGLGGLAAAGAAVVVLLQRARPGALAVVGVPAPGGAGPAAARPSLVLCAAAAAMVFAGIALARKLRITTSQWAAAPMFFVSVRADFDEPVVLREVRRLADFLRAEPGVANAWSAADLFTGVTFEGDEASRIPDDAEEVRRVLVQARNDPAVRLELAGDHREGLVAVRFDGDPNVDHQDLVDRLERYIDAEMRHAIVHVDVDAPGTSPATRAFGQGLLALDARERVLRISDRSGHALGPAEALSIERVARQAATIPAADPARLDLEVAETVRDVIARHPFPLPPAEATRLVGAIKALGEGATVPAIELAVASAYGPHMPDPVLRATALTLARRVTAVRRRLIARANFRDMLTGADLPTEGVLADEVRGATAEAMGPVVGVPVSRDVPSAYTLDAMPVGGAANDRALSRVWNRALPAGVASAAVLLAILLVWVGGLPGALSLPLALAPLALAVAPAALLGEPVGLPTVSFFGGALAGGAALATSATLARAPEGAAGISTTRATTRPAAGAARA
jgi:hypothetical protein